MDDEPMWAADRVNAPTPGSAITIPETANEFAIKDTKNEAIRLDDVFPCTHGRSKNMAGRISMKGEHIQKRGKNSRTAFISDYFP
ncbi:hypothetical protein Tco_0879161 [Tanacetum coccineum]